MIEQVELMNMCMVTDAEGRVLVEDRVKSGWTGVTFPGGHVERGESFTDSTVREIYEETGLRISDLRICGTKQWFNEDGTRCVVICYQTDKYEGQLKSSEEGRVFWTNPEKLSTMRLAPGMEETFRIFFEKNYTEHYIKP